MVTEARKRELDGILAEMRGGRVSTTPRQTDLEQIGPRQTRKQELDAILADMRGGRRAAPGGGGAIFSGGKLMDVLDVISAPGYASMGAIHEFAEPVGKALGEGRGLAGLGEGIRSIPGGAWRGIKGRASFRDILQETTPEFTAEHPWLAAAASLGADIATYPVGVTRLATRGAGAAVKAASRGMVDLAVQAPGVGQRIGQARASTREWMAGREALRGLRRTKELGELGLQQRRDQVVHRVKVEAGRLAEEAGERRASTWRRALGRRSLTADRRGIVGGVPDPLKQAATPGDIEVLVGAWAEGASPSGKALNAVDARLEVEGIARAFGLDMKRFGRLGRYAKGQGKAYQPRLVKSGLKSVEELAKMEEQGGYVRRVYEHFAQPLMARIAALRKAGKVVEAQEIESWLANRVYVKSGGKAPVHLLTERQNLGLAARTAYEEIPQVGPRLFEQFRVLGRTLPKMEMFDGISKSPKLAQAATNALDAERLAAKGWLQMPTVTAREGLERAEKLRLANRLQEADEVLALTQSGGWGKLAGMWVAPVVHDALIPKGPRVGKLRELVPGLARWVKASAAPAMEKKPLPTEGFWAAEARMLAPLKRGWTVWNSGGSFRNDMANMVAMHSYAGVPMPYVPYFYARGWYHAVKKTPSSGR